MISKRKTKAALENLMKNTLKAFHLALFHSKNSIGASCLYKYHHEAREMIRECIKNLDGREDDIKKQAMQFHELIKLCYENFSNGDIAGAKTYFYHMESILENFGVQGYKLKIPI